MRSVTLRLSLAAPASDHPAHRGESRSAPWWRHAVIYQVYPRSFADGDGDGMGDLPGITARLPYLADLGVDAVWISPWYTSPQADAGYDVADYRDIDPLFGTLADADELVARAHELEIKVIIDLVPNHTSDEHEWFRAAKAAAPGSPERARYVFRDGRGEGGAEPPTNWRSVFGGSAWTRLTDAAGNPEQWYLNLFDSKQPDLNWENPEVRAEMESILRFWLDRGIDGFRVDVAHGLVKDQSFRPWEHLPTMISDVAEPRPTGDAPMWDQDGVHDIYRSWRTILDGYNPGRAPQQDRILCAEAWVTPVERAVLYTRPDEMHQAFNFAFLETSWRAADLRSVVEASFTAADMVGAPSTWVLSNHDVVRHTTRLGYPVGTPRTNGVGPGSPQPDAALGLRRARAATTLMLALPGSSYLYQGEELGLPEHTTLPDDVRQDPAFLRTRGTAEPEIGRDGCRVPMPWAKGVGAGNGFGGAGTPWLPQPASYADLAADQQIGVEGSTHTLYRTLLALRRDHDLGVGALTWVDGYGDDVVAFVNSGAAPDSPAGQGGTAQVLVVANLGADPVALPDGATVLVTSGPLTDDSRVPSDTTVWALTTW